MASSRPSSEPAFEGFPLGRYSYSDFYRFSTNPLMFKVERLNHDSIETTTSASNVLGSALHRAMQAYLGGADIPAPEDDGDAIRFGFEAGLNFLKGFSDGFIDWKEHIPNRVKLEERYAFTYFQYVKDLDITKRASERLIIEKPIEHRVSVNGKELPVPLKAVADLVYRRRRDGKLVILDHKFPKDHSDPDKIDAGKLLQAAFNFFTVYAETGERPHSIEFAECRVVENRDKSKSQTVVYEMVFEDTPLMFELFFRFYEDVTDALMGKMVYVPNLAAIFDKEVAILAYIHRLDIDEVRAKALAKHKVENITEFLKKRIQKDGAMKRYLETVSGKFVSASTLNYKDMTIPERIKMKLAEHGVGVEFHSQVDGSAVTLYRFEPSVGVKMTRIESFVKDLEQVVGMTGIRVLAPIPDSELVGFEVPVKDRTFPGEAPKARAFDFPLGVGLTGEKITIDLREAPHALIAGTTGSGKSVCLSNLIQHATSMPKSTLEVMLLDPKMVELAPYADEANVTKYIDSAWDVEEALKDLEKEMNARYRVLRKEKCRSLEEYRAKGGKTPYIFVFFDEFGDVIMQNITRTQEKETGEVYLTGPRKGQAKVERIEINVSEEIRKYLIVLAQKARASGIHIILSTQHPVSSIVDGAIKANFPTRIAFRTVSSLNSRVILDDVGADKLLGKGDGLLKRSDGSPITRFQAYSV